MKRCLTGTYLAGHRKQYAPAADGAQPQGDVDRARDVSVVPPGPGLVVFAILVLPEAQLLDADTILLATYVSVGLSVLLHGLSAGAARSPLL